MKRLKSPLPYRDFIESQRRRGVSKGQFALVTHLCYGGVGGLIRKVGINGKLSLLSAGHWFTRLARKKTRSLG